MKENPNLKLSYEVRYLVSHHLVLADEPPLGYFGGKGRLCHHENFGVFQRLHKDCI